MTTHPFRVALGVLLLPCLAAAQSDPGQTPPTHPGRFVEITGEMEFRGVLTALPLQAEDAAKYGLTQAQLEARRAAAQAALAEHTLVEYIPATDQTLIEVGLGNEQAAAEALMAGGAFRYVTPDWVVYPLANCTSDPLLGNQWHHDANIMNSCDGWDIETGDPSVTVALCDTGINIGHSEFQQHRQEGYNAVDQQWENSGGSINDVHGHGTMTTGCSAANGDNGNGISGVGWNLGHRMMRVSNSSSGSSTLSILSHAARTASDAGDRVVNISYSGVSDSSNQTTGAYCRAQGTLVVWAAGNSGSNMSGNRDDELIVVIATTSSDTKPGWSSYGSFCDLSAPGESVYTTSGSNSYSNVSGTSFSAPLTAGLLGVIFSADPSLTPQQAEDYLRAGCDDLGSNGVDNTYGYGRIDVGQTLALIPLCGPETYCTASNNSTGNAAMIGYLGSASVAANDLTLGVDLGPPGQFGLFFFGDAQANTASGDGVLCVGGSLTRFSVVQTDFFGSASQAVDLNNLPNGVIVSPGDTTNFSFWCRDSTPGGWNFSNGLSVQWCN
jgi:subtilisin family serine protease